MQNFITMLHIAGIAVHGCFAYLGHLTSQISSFKGAPDPLLGKLIEVCYALERFCKKNLIVCHNRTVSTKN